VNVPALEVSNDMFGGDISIQSRDRIRVPTKIADRAPFLDSTKALEFTNVPLGSLKRKYAT